MKPRILDLYCKAGGMAQGYADAGFEVVGVDHVDQLHYPFEFLRMDALDALRVVVDDHCGFDAIHASCPCQFAADITPDQSKHSNLIPATRELLIATGLPYVIENVPGAAKHLRNPIQICGSGLNLGVRRHRLFETNFPVMGVPCAHGGQAAKFDVYEHGHWYKSPFAKVYGSGGGKAKEHWGEAMGISWMTDAELQEAIPPAYAEHIGHFLLAHLQTEQKAAA